MIYSSQKLAAVFIALLITSALAGCEGAGAASSSTIPPAPEVTSMSGTEASSQIRSGVWGSDSAALTVTNASSTLKLACASGSLDQPLNVDPDNHFQATGTYQKLSGPIEKGDPGIYAATYSGQVQGDSLSITVQYVDSAQEPQTDDYTLVYGDTNQVFPICPR